MSKHQNHIPQKGGDEPSLFLSVLAVFLISAVLIFITYIVILYHQREKSDGNNIEITCGELHSNNPREYEACLVRLKGIVLSGDGGKIQRNVCKKGYGADTVAFEGCLRRVMESGVLAPPLLSNNVSLSDGKFFDSVKKEFCLKEHSESTDGYLHCLGLTSQVVYCDKVHPERGDNYVECVLRKKW